MKIIHISIARKLTNGQRKQLASEYYAASSMSSVSWETVAYDDYGSDLPFSHKIPFPFRFMLLRNAFGWLVSIYYSRKNDYVLLRHMTFDPFSLIFAPLIDNRISVHHAKEVEELLIVRRDWRGQLASTLERWCGAFALKRVAVISGVTNEIAEYEKCRSNSLAKTVSFPNGINTDHVQLLCDNRVDNAVNIAFICGTFSEWHGLDKLINSINKLDKGVLLKIGKVHLIGKLFEEQISLIGESEILSNLFCIHGSLEEYDFRSILDGCDIGLSSFALERKGLMEASTLKVRELLAMGLPIYSGHIDSALPKDFKYYRYEEEISLLSMIDFAFSMKNHSRSIVADCSKRFIDKGFILKDFVKFLGKVDGQKSLPR